MIEIELNERLRRRREELRLKIDALALAEGDEAASADDLEARTRELKTLNNSIQALTKKSQGERRWTCTHYEFTDLFIL
jgi:structural maintenance of chromosome 3 (chondroitin sulfate proteoglycan 6)